MAFIALIAAAEAMLFSASGAKRNQVRRQRVLMGNSLDPKRCLPFVDDYLKTEDSGCKQSPDIRCFQTDRLLSPSCSHTVVRISALARDSNGISQTPQQVPQHTKEG